MRCRIRHRPELLLAGALALVAAGCQEHAASVASDAPSAAPVPAPRYADEVARIDADLARHRASAGAGAGRAAWPAHEQAARALLERAALTGDFEDHAGAVAAIDAAEQLAGPAAVCATAARVALAVHRLDQARAALARCAPAPADAAGAAELAALAADLAVQDGRYGDALRGAREVLARRETPADLARLALLHEATGAPIEALALLDRAERVDHAGTPALRAWLAVRRGLVALHRGRWDEALAHYLAAQGHLAGWWLVEEHIAEVRALLGQRAAALALYENLLAAQPRPEVMDAHARLLRAVGRGAEAERWILGARDAHRLRERSLPEAAAAHALAHFLAFAPGAPATLERARRGAARRRTGEAQLALARALLAANLPGPAMRAVDAARATSWNTAELYAVAHEAARRAGLAEQAQAAAAQAAAMNPRWRSQYGQP